jgi:stage V sporulation protein SpoVS
MKGEILMMNFKNAKENAMNKVGNHSTLITFIFATIGVAATAYLASKEIPKAKAEVKEILAKEDLTKTQKATETVKVVAKSTWKTGAVAIATILLVTGTAKIAAVNTAATVASVTNIANMYEQKYMDAKQAIDDIPDKKVREETQRAVTQKVINRATNEYTEEDFKNLAGSNPNMYPWVNDWDGMVIMATYNMVDTLEEIVDGKITQQGNITVGEVYELLERLGAKILWNDRQNSRNKIYNIYGWEGGFSVKHTVYLNGNGDTVYNIILSKPEEI